MLTNIFGKGTQKKVHCEINGNSSTIEKTRILSKINGIINLKLLDKPQIDFDNKIIYPINKPPIKFFIKLHVPSDLKPVIGDLFATVEDIDEVEQSTHILSDDGMDYFMLNQLLKLLTYFKDYEIINFSETMFFVSVNDVVGFHTQLKKCDNWGINYQSVGKKYMVKKILETKKESQTFGTLNILSPGYDIAINDCSANNPNGTGYLFKTDRNFNPMNICSNESAVDYCIKNNCLAYYTDFINGGKMRVLSKYTEDINKNLQNVYRFRSSNI